MPITVENDRVIFKLNGTTLTSGGPERALSIGFETDAIGELTLTDGTFSSEKAYVGRNGTGTLNITEGGLASNRSSYIGDAAGAMARAVHDACVELWIAGGVRPPAESHRPVAALPLDLLDAGLDRVEARTTGL